jgi:hypothetical protein
LGRKSVALVGDSSMTPSRPAQLARFPCKEIFKDKLPVAAVQQCTATMAFYLPVNSLRADLNFDELIKRPAVWALEWFCPDHGRPTAPAGAAKSQRDYQT